MLIDRLDPTTLWGVHVNTAATPIGGVPPLAYGSRLVPAKKTTLLCWTSGNSQPGSYPAVEFYPAQAGVLNGVAEPRQIPVNTGNVSLSYGLDIDAGTPTNANVIETDLLIVTGGMKYNLSGQRHVATGQIDIGNWTSTGLLLGALKPNVQHKVKWAYSFNLTAKTCSVVSYECDKMVSQVPTSLGNMPATASNWTPGVYVQVQLGSLPAGAPWSILVSNLKISWW
jgi:hypothetical protein